MGGGGFAHPPGDPALEEYLLGLAETATPRICLLPTASGGPDEQIRRFYPAYRHLPCEPTHVSLFRLGTNPVDLRELILGQDVVYVGGGSLLNLLAIWRAHELDAVLREAWERGVVLAKAKAQAEYQKCKSQIGPVLDRAQTLNSHLTVGMNESDYTSEVGDVRAAYDRVPFKEMSFQCASAGLPLEKALNVYAKVATTWNNCITDVNCSSDSIKPELQAQWSKASVYIETAKSSLDGLNKP